MTTPPWPSGARYRATRRRLLVDMHIPDWDPAFLHHYQPDDLVRAAEAVGADGVMLYFQSHVGLCYYPTRIGTMHRAARDRDLAGDAVAALRRAGKATCGYYSVNFNNQAWLDHPSWRLKPAAPATVGVLPRQRYGIVCLNNPDYRAFVDAQVDEILAYPIDAMFFDMVWWNGVCVCPSCQARYRSETGAEIPRIADWNDPAWTRFQRSREAWLTGLAVELRQRVISARPEMEVYHNFALGLSNWTRGVSFDSIDGHDFLGGDFYGGPTEQLLINRLLSAASPRHPAEFMTTVGMDLTEHTRLRSAAAMRLKALGALLSGNAFLAILAIDPDGKIEPVALDRIGAAFAAMRAHDPGDPGQPIETVGVYCSDRSKLDRNGPPQPLADAPASSLPDYPHFHALLGATRALQRAHIPFGIVTRRVLDRLDRWPALVLPNVEVLEADEIAEIRAYVRGGGRLYASRSTSLDDAGQLTLGDVFGCAAHGHEDGARIYVEAPAIAGMERPLSHVCPDTRRTGAVRISAAPETEVLATRTLPYGYPDEGRVGDQRWATIHASPPWEKTFDPMIVTNAFGAGTAIYSALDLEAGESIEHEAAFIALIERLVPQPALRASTHSDVWMSGFAKPGRVTAMLLHYPANGPALPIPDTRLALRLAPGERCKAVRSMPSQEPLEFTDNNGEVQIIVPPFSEIAVVEVDLG